MKPDFTTEHGWDVVVERGQLLVKGSPAEDLFYELGVKSVDLGRNGKNFTNKQSLIEFLETSDFFRQLQLPDTMAQNSLEVVKQRVQDYPYYYLTVLDRHAIENLSTLSVSPAPDNLNRIYYAIYPTPTPVAATGDLVYPEISTNGSTLTEVGEVIVDEDVVVFWE